MNPQWHKSTYSQNSGGNCVEVAEGLREVRVRDTQHRHRGGLIIDNPTQVNDLSSRFMRLTAEAMSPGDSRRLLAALGNRDELANE